MPSVDLDDVIKVVSAQAPSLVSFSWSYIPWQEGFIVFELCYGTFSFGIFTNQDKKNRLYASLSLTRLFYFESINFPVAQC